MSELPAPRRYFSERLGRGPKAEPLPFEKLRKMVIAAFDSLRERGYFQEAFGIECVDGDSPGTLGHNPSAYFERVVMREGIWPYWTQPPTWAAGDSVPASFQEWDEDTLFDVVEVCHDLVSKGVDGS